HRAVGRPRPPVRRNELRPAPTRGTGKVYDARKDAEAYRADLVTPEGADGAETDSEAPSPPPEGARGSEGSSRRRRCGGEGGASRLRMSCPRAIEPDRTFLESAKEIPSLDSF